MTNQQGAHANFSGKSFEGAIRGALEEKGFITVTNSLFQKHPKRYAEIDRLLITNAPYPTIYRHTGRMEFLIRTRQPKRYILLNAKRQTVAGSVDEKFPYLYMNALHNLPQRETMIVAYGNGWKQGAMDWLKSKADETPGFYVFSYDEFITWLQDNF